MIDSVIFYVTFAAAIGCGLVAGMFLAFSSFVMEALSRIPSEHGIRAMQAINVAVINAGFFLAFFGAGALCVGLVAGGIYWFGDLRGKLLLVGAALYLIGCIGVTMRMNVPLNYQLAAENAGTPEADAMWTIYLDRWPVWNSVRAISAAGAMIAFVVALICRPGL